MHAEIKIGDSIIMLADEFPEMGAKSPQTLGGSPVGLCVYVPNVDAQFQQAIAAGAKEERPVKDQFYGDRSGTLRDPFGHQWTIATHTEDLTPEEINQRAAEADEAAMPRFSRLIRVLDLRLHPLAVGDPAKEIQRDSRPQFVGDVLGRFRSRLDLQRP